MSGVRNCWRPAAIAEQGGNVDKIRDILFGSQMRVRLTLWQVGGDLAQECSDLKESVREAHRIRLEVLFKKELESLAARS